MKSRPASINLSVNSECVDSIDTEDMIKAVENFEIDSTTFPDKLDDFLTFVAKTGNILTSWYKVQPVFIHKLKTSMDEFYKETPYKPGMVNPNCENQSFEYLREIFLKQASAFESPPFTFQRLCELLQKPKENYTKCEKFMRAIEKNLTVVSSWSYPPRRSTETATVNGSSDFNTPVKPDIVSVMNYPGPRPALPPSPMLTSNHATTITILTGDNNKAVETSTIVTNLTQALEEAEKQEEADAKEKEEATASIKKEVDDDETEGAKVETTTTTSTTTEEKETSSCDVKVTAAAAEVSSTDDAEVSSDEVTSSSVAAPPSDSKMEVDKAETFKELHGEQVKDNTVMGSDIHGQHRPTHASGKAAAAASSTEQKAATSTTPSSSSPSSSNQSLDVKASSTKEEDTKLEMNELKSGNDTKPDETAATPSKETCTVATATITTTTESVTTPVKTEEDAGPVGEPITVIEEVSTEKSKDETSAVSAPAVVPPSPKRKHCESSSTSPSSTTTDQQDTTTTTTDVAVKPSNPAKRTKLDDDGDSNNETEQVTSSTSNKDDEDEKMSVDTVITLKAEEAGGDE